MDGPKSTTRLTARQNRTPTGKSSPWISAIFSFHLFSFHQEFPTAHINSYNITLTIFMQMSLLQRWSVFLKDCAVVCKTLKNLWPTSLVLGGLLLFFGLHGEWVVSVWKWSTILNFSNKHRAHAYWFNESF